MRETEVKILEVDRPALEAKLAAVGARRVFDDAMTALFYQPGPQSAATFSGVLRLRKEGPRTCFTFKGPVTKEGAKVRDEFEVQVSDFDTMKLILRSLGLVATSRIRKHRVTYELGNVRFAFDRHYDDLAHIPEFLEIEGPDLPTIHENARRLGYRPEDCRPWGIADLVDYYSERRG